jgi:outer membrane protein
MAVALVLGLLFTAGTEAEAQQARFGYINTQRVMAQAPGVEDAQRRFEQEMAPLQAEVDSMARALQQAQQNLQRQAQTLSNDARQQRQQALGQQFEAYQMRVAELDNQAQQRHEELLQPILQPLMPRISQVIEQIRAEGNFAMIFDASAGGLITADPALDLTDQVLQRLRGS